MRTEFEGIHLAIDLNMKKKSQLNILRIAQFSIFACTISFTALKVASAKPPSDAAGLVDCSPQNQNAKEFLREIHLCDQSQQLQIKRYVFARTGTPSSQFNFKEGKVREIFLWNIEQELTALYKIDHLEDGSWIRKSFDTKTGGLIGKSRNQGIIDEEQKITTLQKWRIEKGAEVEIDTLTPGTDEISLRQTLSPSGEIERQYELSYLPRIGYAPKYLKQVIIKDSKGLKVGEYRKTGLIEIDKIIASLSISKSEKEKLFSEYRRPKEPVLIIDSGFDLTHPELLVKSGGNRGEQIDGLDNDNNGWVDDLHGWNALKKSADVDDSIILQNSGSPISHGTHVTSIALKDTLQFSFLGYAGNMTDPHLLERALKELKRLKIRFANMSFGWESEDTAQAGSPFSPGGDSSYALEDLVKSSPETLFFAAAGNSGTELRIGISCEVPPCLLYPNIIKVGALSIAEATPSLMESAEIADFSNYSKEFVDLYSPGENVLGAGIGGQTIPLSGTSMASPLTLNTVLRMSEIYPDLTNQMLKEILLKSVYIPDLNQPLPARSGGMLFPERALSVVRLLKLRPNSKIDELIQEVRQTGRKLKGEHHQSFDRLKAFWKERNL